MPNKRNLIQLSFKNEGSDLELYTFLKNKLNPQSYIKEELWGIYKNGAPNTRITLVANETVQEADVLTTKEDLFKENVERDNIEEF